MWKWETNKTNTDWQTIWNQKSYFTKKEFFLFFFSLRIENSDWLIHLSSLLLNSVKSTSNTSKISCVIIIPKIGVMDRMVVWYECRIELIGQLGTQSSGTDIITCKPIAHFTQKTEKKRVDFVVIVCTFFFSFHSILNYVWLSLLQSFLKKLQLALINPLLPCYHHVL